MKVILASHARLFGWLVASCLAGNILVTGRLDWAPAGLVAAMVLLLAWYAWGEVTLPRTPLSDPALADPVAVMARLAGSPPPRLVVIDAECGAVTVPEILNRAGEVVFGTGDLAAHPLSHHLAQAARQLAVAQTPPRYRVSGLLATGWALGLLAGVHTRWGASPGVAVALFAALGGLFAAVAAGGTRAAEERARQVDERARALLGQLRDELPEAFADLAARQGLPAQPTNDSPPTACRPGPPSLPPP